MSDSAANVPPQQAVSALALMEQALALLDEVQTPGEVAGHLDLAICRLREGLPLTTAVDAQSKSDESPSAQQTSASSPKPGS